ncbi:hypothetical protein RDWZM_000027 [Blomia tropicalis]|uniref:BING4 C-terminal domain-containing protein n=1 Tax=Blomia tropicalis TaxID=40697 RepID=A0A9Q0M9D3_BLOTA|nr:WD repeat-containing protein 46 [Blomia tropicalis]KAJ6221482.1 hypothetical protein RDWZM_000027 [Blomia tropicalis]
MSARKVKKVAFSKDEIQYFFKEESGLLEADDNEETYQITQKEIVKAVDITSATKHFDLSLPHLGPYKLDYFRNGRSLLLGGRNGHVAAFDWVTKDLKCEFNVKESVHAVQWLHMPTMFAVAQSKWTYVYDDKGTEIHCLKRFFQSYELDFLPYHFLLVGASENGYLSWLDISIGELVANLHMKKSPRVTALTHNPANAISITGHPNGTVRMWSPNVSEPLVSLLCHPSPVRDIAVDKRGNYMVTTASDRSVRIWDIRNYKCVQHFKVQNIPSKIDMSQRDLLAVSSGDLVEVFKLNSEEIRKPYMRHRLDNHQSAISSIRFCPYEDVLGVGHSGGFTSLLIPGSGEPNFDALEANPYMSRTQRREMEVKALLEKVSYEMITLDANFLAKVSNKKRAPKITLEQKRKLKFKNSSKTNKKKKH